MGEVKANIGKMVHKMQFFEPESTKSSTGEVIVEYKPSTVFLSDVLDCSNNSERLDNSLSGKHYLKFAARYYCITTDWKVEYNGVRYDISNINLLERGLCAVYECSKIKLE